MRPPLSHVFQNWLKCYGYLLPSGSRAPELHSGKALQSAVSTMQQFYGIPVTGVLDQTTIEWMKKPRCGVPDHPHLSRRRRNKRYALTGQKWRQKHITYRCLEPPPFPGFSSIRARGCCRCLSFRGPCCRWWVCDGGESQAWGHRDQVLRAYAFVPLGASRECCVSNFRCVWSFGDSIVVSCLDSYSF